MSNQKNIKESAFKSLIVGGIGFGVSKTVFGDNPITFMGRSMPSSQWVGLAVAGSSFAGNFIAPFVLNALPQPKGLVKAENMLINPALTGLGAYMVARQMGEVDLVTFIGLGMGSEIAGSYAYATVAPMVFGSQDEEEQPNSMQSMEYF